jgi:hypothetical protein
MAMIVSVVSVVSVVSELVRASRRLACFLFPVYVKKRVSAISPLLRVREVVEVDGLFLFQLTVNLHLFLRKNMFYFVLKEKKEKIILWFR